MLLAFHGATTMPQDLETDVAVTAAAGFRALEVWAAKIDRYLAVHSVADLNALFVNAGVMPLTINSIEFIAFRLAEEYAAIRVRCRELSRIAQAIGCPTVVVVPSPTPDRSLPWDEVVAEYVRVLRDLGEIADEFGVRLSFEFLGFGWCSVRTPRAAAEIVRAVGRANVGMTVDAAHFYGGGGLLEELEQLDPARIFAFHLDDLEDTPKEAITDATRVLPGLGIVPLADICRRLQAIGYDGPCSIELFRPEYWSWNPHDLAVKAREAAVRVLTPHFHIE
ncbi:MAG: sugar phosphate isomerase/epimerase [Chloroflexi bacterium]|nr:sugar phosphate isomerase/epimerase [Chloroflexota bacterium]